MFSTNIKSVLDLITTFSTEDKCMEYLELIRWGNNPISPFDATSTVYKCKGYKYKCKNTGKYFNVKTGTMYDNTKMPLQKWFLAVWLVTAHKKGISSMQLGRDLDITQKSAWFMLQRIRACFGIENDSELDGVVEVDETFVGGKNKKRHHDKKVPLSQGRSFKDKVPVLGMLQRGGKLVCAVVNNTQKQSIQPLIRHYVKEGAKLISDEWRGYNGLGNRYRHKIVNHGKKEYVNKFDSGIHSNSIEGFWGILKRGLIGIYNKVSKKHLQLYVDEFVYRFNMRLLPDSDKFNWLLVNSGVRTKYKELIQ
ncbi:transposase [Flavobacterium beibuense F44-8]|uniref:Transposase n=1 Tax=Flavobacterium beibuense F44-8 TaxID=1406840 RepID=A0A0A2LRI4_9FLAO|nr:IS1595 family transposase [Flavobacterium beibuense]KGO78810.1 transposase [Flavobacterium beibuense F44-8]